MGLDGFIRLMIDRTDVKVGLQGFKDGLDPSDNVIELPDLLLAIAFETYRWQLRSAPPIQCLDTHRQDVSIGYQSSQGVSVLNYLNVGDVDAINQVFQLDDCFIQFLVQFLQVIARLITLLHFGAFLDTFFQLSHFLLQVGSDAQCFC